MELISKTGLEELRWPVGARGRAILTRLARDGVSAYLEDSSAELSLVRTEDAVVPVVTGRSGDSWTPCTPSAEWPAAGGLRRLLTPALRLAGLDATACVNHWMVPMGPGLGGEDLQGLLRGLSKRFPRRALVLKDIDPVLNPGLAAAADAAGLRLLPGREVRRWRLGAVSAWSARHRHVLEREQRLLGPVRVSVREVRSTSPRTLRQMRALYRAANTRAARPGPDYREPWFAAAVESDTLFVLGVYKDDELRAFAICHDGGRRALTRIAIGCDPAARSNPALMRILASAQLHEAARSRLGLVVDADALEFEHISGGETGALITAVYTRHLPFYQRVAWWAHARPLPALPAPGDAGPEVVFNPESTDEALAIDEGPTTLVRPDQLGAAYQLTTRDH
jgi:hypothetical protein